MPDRKPIKFAKTTLAGRYQPIIRAHSVVNYVTQSPNGVVSTDLSDAYN